MLIKDIAGNRIEINPYGDIRLCLSGKRARMIGRILKEEGSQVYEKWEKKDGIFIKNDSWSLCWSLADKLNEETIVRIHYAGITYELSIKEIKAKGSFLNFKNSGIEKKIYIPRDLWRKRASEI